MKRTPRLLIVIIILAFIVVGTAVAIQFAKGYRPSIKSKSLEGTGLLSANSFPRGASVFINNKLTTATDDTLNLPPGEYLVKIAKDGYTPWEKTLILESELVAQTNARLFPSVPDLNPLTFSGSINPTPSPDGSKIVFAVNNATTDAKNGLYVLELSENPLNFNSNATQITRSTQKYDFTSANLTWSPDSTEILATLNSNEPNELNLILSPRSFNDIADLKDVTAQLPVILDEWSQLLDKSDHQRLTEFPEFIQQVATQSAEYFYFSPEKKRLLYLANQELNIPESLSPTLVSSSTQPQSRHIQPNTTYIYDLEEDRNFVVSGAHSIPTSEDQEPNPLQTIINRYSPLKTLNVQWYPDSNHVIIITQEEANSDQNSQKIIIAEYDNTNHQTVYAGPFASNFAFPWPNGSKLIILASLNGGSDLPPNLYSINLK